MRRVRERVGDLEPVLATSDQTERERALGHMGVGGRLRGPRAVEIADVLRLGGDLRAEVVLDDGIEQPPVAVDPDRVVPGGDRRTIAARGPFLADRRRIVEHVTQPEHAAGAAFASQADEAALEFAAGAARDVVHDQHVRAERRQDAVDGPGAKVDQVAQRDGKRPCVVLAGQFLAQAGQRQAVDAARHRQRARLVRAADQQHRRVEVRLCHATGNREVAADMPQPHGVVRVQDDAGGRREPWAWTRRRVPQVSHWLSPCHVEGGGRPR